ncbi:MAG: DUF1361 domain-containing protein [Chloracidobacterium sp.]|uniref:DUF1361 domain-containing protein n=1 Tax=Chloracidobacterium validum TaxID=2821543 RepID=A0ABX8B8Y0_9BACT|nr:DUF1361 domain-containing protein [Chloracidobacterium validum]QUW03397.1 DUF1361 domain-containing protein [Chloracidobacterium validum]
MNSEPLLPTGRDNRARLPLTLAALGFATLWCLGLLCLRWRLTNNLHYAFLAWNLFLAVVPLGLALWLSRIHQRPLGLVVLLGWLVFFPNAPYVVTDLIHLSPYGRAPLWFDVLLLASFAMAALGMGLASLQLVHEWVEAQFSALIGWTVTILICPLAGFGVYLGRFGRWNSWDVVQRPVALLTDVAIQLTTPQSAARAIAMTLGFAGLLFVTYGIWWAHGRPLGLGQTRKH